MNRIEKYGVVIAIAATATTFIGYDLLSAPEEHRMAWAGMLTGVGIVGVLVGLLTFGIGRMIGDGPAKAKAAKAAADATEMASIRGKVKSMNMD